MNSPDTLRLLLRNWLLIAAVTLLVGAATFGYSKSRTPIYTSTAGEYVTMSAGATATELAQGANYISNQMGSFGALVTAPVVLDPVIADLGLNQTDKELARTVVVTTPRSTVIIQIAVNNADPNLAASIANAISKQLSVSIDNVGPRLASGRPLVAIRSIQTAVPPIGPSSPKTRRNGGLGLIVGLALGCGIVLLRSRLDTRVRSAGTVETLTDAPVLGTVRHSDRLRARGLAIIQDPDSQVAEDLRQLRANLIEAGGGRTMSVLVTSSVRSEGRTTISANLAAALSEAGRSTLLVDGDLRQPHVEQLTGTDESFGVLDVIRGTKTLDQALQCPDGLGFSVLAAGGTHPNPTQLISSAAFGAMMGTLRARFDFVVVDSPGLLAVADATALHDSVDGALFVVHASAVTTSQVRAALGSAQASGVRTFGVVMNDVKERDLPSGGGYAGKEGKPTPPAPESIPSWD